MLTLFQSPGSCSLASLIALEESGIEFQVRRISTKDGDQRSADYLAINPKGRVPALVTDEGVLTETPAILVYVAQISKTPLAPLDNPFRFAKMQAANAFFSSTVHVNHAHGPRASRWSDDADAAATMKAKVPQTMTEAFSMVEKHLLEGPWVLGEEYSVADPYLFTMFRWAEGDAVDVQQFPKLLAHRAAMMERPGVQQALSREVL